MWKLFKADGEYNRFINIIQWPVILMLFAANSIRGNLETFAANVMFWLLMVIAMVAGIEYVKTKRIRLLAGLPLPVRRLALYRYLGIVLGWSIWMAFLILSSLISKRGHLDLHYAYWVLLKTGSIFIFVGGVNLATDLYYFVPDRKMDKFLIRYIVGSILWTIIGIAGPFFYLFVSEFTHGYQGQRVFWAGLTEMLYSFPGALGILLAGLIFMALDVYIFERRRSYLESTII